jgi:hypothetical protein
VNNNECIALLPAARSGNFAPRSTLRIQAHDSATKARTRSDEWSARLPTEPAIRLTSCVCSALLNPQTEARPELLLARFTRIHRHQIETLHEIELHDSNTISPFATKIFIYFTSATIKEQSKQLPYGDPKKTPRIEPRRAMQDPPILNSRRDEAITCSMRLMQVPCPAI